MITQRSPLFQVMSLPVSTLAANEMAARASMNTPRLTPTSTAKAVKRDAKPEYLPCRLSRMTAGGPEGVISPARAGGPEGVASPADSADSGGPEGAGGPEGVASPARVVMILPGPAARQAGRAGRCRGGGGAALSSGR